MSGWSGLAGVWPAVLVCGGSFAAVQYLWSNFVGVELVDIVGGLVSIAALALFLRVWRPERDWDFPGVPAARASASRPAAATPERQVLKAWMPWLFLSVAVIIWGLAPSKAFLNGGPAGLAAYRAKERPAVSGILAPAWNVPLLHRFVFRDFPVVTARVDAARIGEPEYRNQHAEAAQFTLNWASATGTAIFVAAVASATAVLRPGLAIAPPRSGCAPRSPPSC